MPPCRFFIALLTGLVAAGCRTGHAPAGTAGAPPLVTKDSISFFGVLRPPGASSAPGAAAGEWVIEMPRDTAGKVHTVAVDVSAVADRAAVLAGQRVRATMRKPTQNDADLGAATVKLTALEAR